MSALSLLLVAWMAAVPHYAGRRAWESLPLATVLTTPSVRSVLAVVLFWMLAHYVR